MSHYLNLNEFRFPARSLPNWVTRAMSVNDERFNDYSEIRRILRRKGKISVWQTRILGGLHYTVEISNDTRQLFLGCYLGPDGKVRVIKESLQKNQLKKNIFTHRTETAEEGKEATRCLKKLIKFLSKHPYGIEKNCISFAIMLEFHLSKLPYDFEVNLNYPPLIRTASKMVSGELGLPRKPLK